MKKLHFEKYGFSMIEVLVGMLLISFGLLALLPMMAVSMRGNDVARDFTEASMLIRDKMEELKNTSNPISGSDTLGLVTRTWTVVDSGPNLRRLEVLVSWPDRDGLVRSNSMITYMMIE